MQGGLSQRFPTGAMGLECMVCVCVCLCVCVCVVGGGGRKADWFSPKTGSPSSPATSIHPELQALMH